MQVLVTGAYGFIGSACLARLHEAGHAVVGAGRAIGTARRRFPYARWIEADFLRLRDADAWQPLLDGIDAVVNCVGVLQDGLGDDVRRVQDVGTAALFDACQRAGVGRVIHMSAIGADAAGPSAFARSKAAAESHLRTLTLDWIILRPALVLGSAVYGGTALLRGLAAFPLAVPLIHADARVQVVSLDDFADTVVQALAPAAPARVSWDLAHPHVHRLADIARALRAWLGFAPRPVLPIPHGLARPVAAVGDALGWLGWRNPARSTALAQLAAGVSGDPRPWIAATGIAPKSLERILAARAATVQDRWFARLYLLKPFAVFIIAVATFAAAAAQFHAAWKIAAGFGSSVPPVVRAVYMVPAVATGGLSLVLGCALVFHATARLALIALAALALVHAADDVVSAWHFGFFPFAVLSYEIPVVLAMLLTLSILDDR